MIERRNAVHPGNTAAGTAAGVCELPHRRHAFGAVRAVTAIALVLAAWLAPAPVPAQLLNDDTVLLDRIVAVVNEGVVLQSELDQEVRNIAQRLAEQGTMLPPRDIFEAQVLERLVVRQIQLQRAERYGVRIDDEALNRALTAVSQRNGISFDQLPDVLAQQGIDYIEYRQELREEMLIEQLRARDVMSRISITQKEVDRRLAEQAGRDTSIEYKVSHILVSTPDAASNDEIAEARRRTTDLRERIEAGEDFGQLAVSYSSGQTALSGGDLGWMNVTSMPTLFVNVVTRLTPGELSDPIPSSSGFHLIRLEETRGIRAVMVKQARAKHILIKPNEVMTNNQAYRRISEIRDRIIGGEDFDLMAKQYSQDPGTANGGGDLGWTSPGSFVPEFEETLYSLAPGEVSQPLRTQFGWHIIKAVDFRDYDQSEELARQEAIRALRSEKQVTETERWIRQMREEAYVEVRLDS
jgi:peptidyl-prolyl cis-trans isomerase SurA